MVQLPSSIKGNLSSKMSEIRPILNLSVSHKRNCRDIWGDAVNKITEIKSALGLLGLE